jgi:hypothetical protein
LGFIVPVSVYWLFVWPIVEWADPVDNSTGD